MNRDAIAFALILAGALCAECIPLAAVLIGVAWVVTWAKKEAVPGEANTENGQRYSKTSKPCCASHFITYGRKSKYES